MTKHEWIAEAMRLHDEAAVLHDAEANVYADGFPQNGMSVEQQAMEAAAEYASARAALESHLQTEWS